MILRDLRILSIIVLFPIPIMLSCSSDKSSEPFSRVPVLTTADITAVTSNSALCGGTITSDGGEAVTLCGICWSTNLTPTVNDSKTSDSLDSGGFVSIIAGLLADTKYYIRSYANNSVGTGYGEIDSFTTLSPPVAVIDIDGNIYHSVTIGSQIWLIENLKVTHYRNGDAIPNIIDDGLWQAQDSGAYCQYNDYSGYAELYGNFYNWFAISDNRGLAPEGWHVASDSEWQILINFLGGELVAGDKLKEAGSLHWHYPNRSTNESGFTALPAGSRGFGGYYMFLFEYTIYWTSTESNDERAGYRGLSYDDSHVQQGSGYKYYGYSVRCVKD